MEINIKMKYYGITYPAFLDFDLVRLAWKRVCCSREWHLFDEVINSSDENYLGCDACELIVHINRIDTSYMDK